MSDFARGVGFCKLDKLLGVMLHFGGGYDKPKVV